MFVNFLLLVDKECRLTIQMFLEHLIHVRVKWLQEILHMLHHRCVIKLLETILVELILNSEDLLLNQPELFFDRFNHILSLLHYSI